MKNPEEFTDEEIMQLTIDIETLMQEFEEMTEPPEIIDISSSNSDQN